MLEHRTSAKTDLIRPHFAESLVISEEFIRNSGLNSAKFMQTAICVYAQQSEESQICKKNKICTRGEWSGITAEMEEQVSNALFTTCIANGALILRIKSSYFVFVRRVPNITGDISAADQNLTNLSAFRAKYKYIFLPKIIT